MTWVKICGITNYEDAMTAARAGADAVGFVFYDASPRWIDSEKAKVITARMPSRVEKIGVFVHRPDQKIGLFGDPDQQISKIAEFVGLAGVQIHANPSTLESALRLPIASQFKRYLGVPVDMFLDGRNRRIVPVPGADLSALFLDSGTVGKPGGTGKRFDWEGAVGVANDLREAGLKLVVAGGLTPANVAEAMRILKPWGVDVSSGVEARPGKKDPEKVRAFINAVRAADGKK